MFAAGILDNNTEAIELKLHENWEFFSDIENQVVFSLKNIQFQYNYLKGINQTPPIRRINESLNKLTDFIEKAADSAMRLKDAFEEVKEKILAEQGKVPVTLKPSKRDRKAGFSRGFRPECMKRLRFEYEKPDHLAPRLRLPDDDRRHLTRSGMT